MTKTFPFRVLLYLLLLALFVHGLNFAIDPLQIYRKQEILRPLFTEKQRLQVPGLARNYTSDATTLIIGSSMTANFRSAQVDERFGELPTDAPLILRVASDRPTRKNLINRHPDGSLGVDHFPNIV